MLALLIWKPEDQEFKIILGLIVSLRPASPTRDPVPKHTGRNRGSVEGINTNLLTEPPAGLREIRVRQEQSAFYHVGTRMPSLPVNQPACQLARAPQQQCQPVNIYKVPNLGQPGSAPDTTVSPKVADALVS